MLKFRKILRESLVAKFLIQLFVFNFFTCQCFATMPAEVLADNFKGNMRSLFASFDEAKDHLSVVLNKAEDKFRLKVSKINDFGEIYTKELFTGIREEEKGSTLDFGFGFRFGLENDSLRLGGVFNNYCEYFETDMNLILSGLILNHDFCVSARDVDVNNALLSGHYLSLRGRKLLNDGLIYSPFLVLDFQETVNEGNIFGRKELTIKSGILENINNAVIEGGGSSKIIAKDHILNNDSTISAKNLRIHTSQMEQVGESLIESNNFEFFGDKIEQDKESRLNVKNKSEINVGVLINRSNDVFLGEEADIFTNVFLNDGKIRTGKANVLVDSEVTSNSRELTVFEYEYSRRDPILGSFVNSGEISGEKLLIDADGYLYNKNLIKAEEQLKLNSSKRFINEGEIFQTERNGLESSITSGARIVNERGKIELASNLSIDTDTSINNREGKIKARNIKIKMALGKNGEFLDNEEERASAQT